LSDWSNRRRIATLFVSAFCKTPVIWHKRCVSRFFFERWVALVKAMPNNSNAKKAMRQSEKARLRNRTGRTTLRTLIRKFKTAVDSQNIAEIEPAFRQVTKRLDQAAAKRLIHPNKAARLKSRLSRHVPKPQATT